MAIFPDAALVVEPQQLAQNTNCLVLPGVGHFKAYMTFLAENDWLKFLRDISESQKKLKVLGICAGFHILCAGSEEAPDVRGLGIFNVHVTSLKPNLSVNPALKVPNIGQKKMNSVPQLLDIDHAYFIHSFAAHSIKSSHERQWIDYGTDRLVAAMVRDNFIGMQYHPELSGTQGIKFLKTITQ
ncbi:glutamine amidotransferase class-I [Thiorhodococcus drewsii AZ1]|uniref:Glutamine amidotransferase class-I n=2 Tax=Thiorhodococcus drewsii TaxID=210408 RepID=G2E7F5_9GAMM|nr:glutamine amidotransferase class-I [Thiorhodococcus drewsii AZ1]